MPKNIKTGSNVKTMPTKATVWVGFNDNNSFSKVKVTDSHFSQHWQQCSHNWIRLWPLNSEFLEGSKMPRAVSEI